jgi:hypothetical protein
MSELDVLERLNVLTFTEANDEATINSATALIATADSSVRALRVPLASPVRMDHVGEQIIPILGAKECPTDDRVPVQEPVKKAFEAISIIQKNLALPLLVKVRPHLGTPLYMWNFLQSEFAASTNKEGRHEFKNL